MNKRSLENLARRVAGGDTALEAASQHNTSEFRGTLDQFVAALSPAELVVFRHLGTTMDLQEMLRAVGLSEEEFDEALTSLGKKFDDFQNPLPNLQHNPSLPPLESVALPPELRVQALNEYSEEDLVRRYKDIQDQGGDESGDFFDKLVRELNDLEQPRP